MYSLIKALCDLHIKEDSLIKMSVELLQKQTQESCLASRCLSEKKKCSICFTQRTNKQTNINSINSLSSKHKPSGTSHFFTGFYGCRVSSSACALVSLWGHLVHDMRWMINMSLGLMIWYFQTGRRSHSSSSCSSNFVLLSSGPQAVYSAIFQVIELGG